MPTVDRPVRNIESVDRNGHMLPRNTSVELDIHVDGSDRWFGEAKSGGRVTAAQVRALAEKARFFAQVDKLPAKILWFVSSSGYDQKAQDFAREHGAYQPSLGPEADRSSAWQAPHHCEGARAPAPVGEVQPVPSKDA